MYRATAALAELAIEEADFRGACELFKTAYEYRKDIPLEAHDYWRLMKYAHALLRAGDNAAAREQCLNIVHAPIGDSELGRRAIASARQFLDHQDQTSPSDS
jgi:hypothetical protein